MTRAVQHVDAAFVAAVLDMHAALHRSGATAPPAGYARMLDVWRAMPNPAGLTAAQAAQVIAAG